MKPFRSLSSSQAKSNLGEVLGSLAAGGPVEITRYGRAVAVLSAADGDVRSANRHRLAELAGLYARGAVSWRKVEEDTGAAFGQLLLELGRQGLALPLATAAKRPAQAEVFRQVLRQAAQARPAR